MENFSDTSGYMISWEENETEGEDYPEEGSEDEEPVSLRGIGVGGFGLMIPPVEPTAPTLPGQPTISFTEEEQVLNSNEEAGQTANNFDLNSATQYPGADDFGNHQDYSNTTTAFENTEASTHGPQNPSRSDFQLEWQRPQTDNTYGPAHGGPDPYKGGNDGNQGIIAYFGMDGRRHTYIPTQDLQTGIPHVTENNQRGVSHQQPSGNRAPSYAAGPLLPDNSWDVAAGSLLAYLHPATVQVSQQTQQQNRRTASIQAAFRASGNSTLVPAKPLSGTNRPKCASRAASTPSEQPPNSSSESFSAPAPQDLYTTEDFFPKCRKGGKLMDDGTTWNKETEQNHYDQFARKYGLPAVPQAVKGGPSRFKLRSNAVDALTKNQRQMLQDFINAAKYFALTGEPNRPGNYQNVINFESDEDGSEMDSANRPGKYRVIAPKKRSRGEADETDDVSSKTSMRTKPNSTVRRGNLQTKSKPSVKNPQGKMTFADMEAADQWLASLGQPSILEAANTLLSNRGIPSIEIASSRLTGFSSNLGHSHANGGFQRSFVAPFPAGFNSSPAGVPGSGHRGSSRLSGPPKRKADTDPEDQNNADHMRRSRVKMPRIDDVGLTNMESSNQAAPRRQHARPKRRRRPQQQQAVPTVHTRAQRHDSPDAESLGITYAGAETLCPEIYGRASVDSGYRSTLSGNANDVDDPSRYANLVPNQNLSQTSAQPSNHRRQSSMENGQTHQSANEGLADEGHDNHQVFDTYFLGVEHENHGDLDFDPTSVEQENLADFDFGVSVAEQDNIGDFGSSSLRDSGSSRNTVPAPQQNESSIENIVSVPQINDDFDWGNEFFHFESLPEDPFQEQKHH